MIKKDGYKFGYRPVISSNVADLPKLNNTLSVKHGAKSLNSHPRCLSECSSLNNFEQFQQVFYVNDVADNSNTVAGRTNSQKKNVADSFFLHLCAPLFKTFLFVGPPFQIVYITYFC